MAYCARCRATYPSDWKRCPKDETWLLASSSVGKYRIESLLGSGGMGAVYRAHNPDTGSPVAIKLLHPSASRDDSARERFQREAAAVAALTTRHLVHVFDFGSEADGTLYLVMEYLRGHTLREEIDQLGEAGQSMALGRIHRVMDGALRGLGAVHRAGITHRDLKPDNIFLARTDDGEVAKIIDFGIARADRGARNLTESGVMMGTPTYMPPETIAGEKDRIGPWSDVYAVGIILFEMLTGCSPIEAESLNELLMRALEGKLDDLRAARADLPEAVYQLVDRALALEPGDRFASGDEMHAAWAAAWAGFPAEVRAAPVPVFRVRPRSAVADEPMPADEMPETTPLDTPEGGAAPARPPDRLAAAGHRNARAMLVALPVVAAAVILGVFVWRAASGNASATERAERGGTTGAAPSLATPAASVASADERDADMVRIPAGRYLVGAAPGQFPGYPDVAPAREVNRPGFLIDRHEMTVGRYRALVGQTPAGNDDPALPVRNVTWHEAVAACAALGKRLPDEEEWEIAARRSPLRARDAHLRAPDVDGPVQVGTHAGDCTSDRVCDLLGNVSEWTASPWRADGVTVSEPTRRAVRGASYRVAPSAELHATVHARFDAAADTQDPEIGFRCARDVGDTR